MADDEVPARRYVQDRMEEGKPTPDPTVLTTEQLLREIDRLEKLTVAQVSGLKELLAEKIDSMKSEVESMRDLRNQKFDAMDDHIVGVSRKCADQTTELAKLVDEKISNIDNNLSEKLVSVKTQFDLIERQRVEQKQDTKAAVDAALAAAKEAVKEQKDASDKSITKTETATAEQLKQMNVTFTTQLAGITSPISDLKDRVTSLESMRMGAKENVSGLYNQMALFISLGLLAIGVLAFLASR